MSLFLASLPFPPFPLCHSLSLYPLSSFYHNPLSSTHCCIRLSLYPPTPFLLPLSPHEPLISLISAARRIYHPHYCMSFYTLYPSLPTSASIIICIIPLVLYLLSIYLSIYPIPATSFHLISNNTPNAFYPFALSPSSPGVSLTACPSNPLYGEGPRELKGQGYTLADDKRYCGATEGIRSRVRYIPFSFSHFLLLSISIF